MKQIFLFLIIVSMPCIVLSQSGGNSTALIKSTPSENNLHNFSATEKNNKVYLQWEIMDNDGVERFEVERSSDGRKFTTAALVFGTEETGTESYKFFEVAKKGKIMYRLKMVNKDLKIEYSNALLIRL